MEKVKNGFWDLVSNIKILNLIIPYLYFSFMGNDTKLGFNEICFLHILIVVIFIMVVDIPENPRGKGELYILRDALFWDYFIIPFWGILYSIKFLNNHEYIFGYYNNIIINIIICITLFFIILIGFTQFKKFPNEIIKKTPLYKEAKKIHIFLEEEVRETKIKIINYSDYAISDILVVPVVDKDLDNVFPEKITFCNLINPEQVYETKKKGIFLPKGMYSKWYLEAYWIDSEEIYWKKTYLGKTKKINKKDYDKISSLLSRPRAEDYKIIS